MEQKKHEESIMETHQRIYANVLTTFRTIILLATSQARGQDNNYSPEVVSVLGMALNNEINSMKRSLQEWLSLTRRMKELWLAGPLGGWEDSDTIALEARIISDSARCAELYNMLQAREMTRLVKEAGGSWEPMNMEDFSSDRLRVGGMAASAAPAPPTSAVLTTPAVPPTSAAPTAPTAPIAPTAPTAPTAATAPVTLAGAVGRTPAPQNISVSK